MLEGVFEGHDVATLGLLDLWTVVHHEAQLRMVERHEGGLRIGVWLKADFATRQLEAGDPLGYGATFVATKPTRVGLVAIGAAFSP